TVLTWNWGGATGSGTGGGTTGAAAGGGETGGGPPGSDAAPRGRRCGAGEDGSSLAGTVPVDGESGTLDWSRASSTRASSGEAIDAPLSSSDGRRRGRPQTFCAREKRQLPPPPVERPRTRTGTPPPGKPWHVGTGAGGHEMPQEQREAA